QLRARLRVRHERDSDVGERQALLLIVVRGHAALRYSGARIWAQAGASRKASRTLARRPLRAFRSRPRTLLVLANCRSREPFGMGALLSSRHGPSSCGARLRVEPPSR